MKRKIKAALLWGSAAAGMAACSSSLTAQEVNTRAQEAAESVETYQTDIALSVAVTDAASGEALSSQNMTTSVTFNEFNMDNHGTVEVYDGIDTTMQEYYSIGDEAYVNIDDAGWVDVSAQQDTAFQNATTYAKVAPIVEILSSIGEMEETEDAYVYRFNGMNEELYEAFQTPYSVTFSGVEPGAVLHEAEVLIDKEDFTIDSVHNILSGETGGYEIVITVEHSYEDINNTGELTIPEEIKTTAQPLLQE